MMNSEVPRVDVPLAVVGCDFRSANVSFREQLVTASEQRRKLFEGIQAMDPGAGFAALETCNRVEWIVASENPHWVAELLAAQVEQLWQAQLPEVDEPPRPSVYVGREAARHLLRVVAGLESLAAGEAQIAGQFQDALLRAREEEMSSPVLNRLASHAGRLAKAGMRIGYRSDHRVGIHGMTARFFKGLFNGNGEHKTILVVGMGAIGRRTAEALEQDLSAKVIRLNRTVSERHQDVWRPFGDLSELTPAADAVVVATGAYQPVLDSAQFKLDKRCHPLVVMDIGVPSQVTPEAQRLSGLDYRNLDDLIELDTGTREHRELIAPMEQQVRDETALFKRFCIERGVVALLEQTQQRRKQFMLEQIPQIVETALAELDPEQRKQVEAAMRQLINDYSYDSFQAIHSVLEQKWSEL